MEHISQKTKRNILLGVCAAAAVAAVILAVHGVTGIMAGGTDTTEGVEYIKKEEAGDIADIESKIARLEKAAEEEKEPDTRSVKEKFAGSVVMGDSVAQGLAEFDVLSSSSVTAQIGANLNGIGDQISAAAGISPKSVFLSFGPNDVINCGGDPEAFAEMYEKTLIRLREEMPDANVFVNSVFPVQDSVIGDHPELQDIEACNEALKNLCISRDIGFIDNTALVKDEYYEGDGLHFKASFYPVWAEHMAEVAAL